MEMSVVFSDPSFPDNPMIFVSDEFVSNGWAGYLAYFRVLALPIFLVARRGRLFENSLIVPGLFLVTSAILMDLLPKAGLVPYIWMLAGALAGVVLKGTAEVDAAPVPSLSSGRRRQQQDGVAAPTLPRGPAPRPSRAAFPRRHGGS